MTPARQTCWAGVFFLLLSSPASADVACGMSDTLVCNKLPSEYKIICVKHVQLVSATCKRATRAERFGSHEDHCKVACKSGYMTFELDRRMREDAIEIVRQSAGDDTAWLEQSMAFWSSHESEGKLCTTAQLDEARQACESHCASVAKRRDLKEMQGLALGKEFLAVEQPEFGCPPSPVLGRLSKDENSLVEWLYPPGHAGRVGAMDE